MIIDYRKYQIKLQKIVQDSDPKIALKQLNQDLYSVKLAQEKCHTLTHIIGQRCHRQIPRYGYRFDLQFRHLWRRLVHGIIEDYLARSPDQTKFLELCQNQDGACFHAIGHSLMLLSKYDLSKSVKSCQKLITSSKQIWCGEGVFMENFDSENTDDSQKPFLQPKDPLQVCQNYQDVYKIVAITKAVAIFCESMTTHLKLCVSVCLWTILPPFASGV